MHANPIQRQRHPNRYRRSYDDVSRWFPNAASDFTRKFRAVLRGKK